MQDELSAKHLQIQHLGKELSFIKDPPFTLGCGYSSSLNITSHIHHFTTSLQMLREQNLTYPRGCLQLDTPVPIQLLGHFGEIIRQENIM